MLSKDEYEVAERRIREAQQQLTLLGVGGG
jgi:hypothetical protein